VHSLPEARSPVISSIEILQEAVTRLPDTIHVASAKDCTYHCFHDRKVPDHMTIWEFVDCAYVRCFQPSPDKPSPKQTVLQGPNGMDLLVAFSLEFAKHPVRKRLLEL
jgi:hypothetical protein